MPMDPLNIWVKEISGLKADSGKSGDWADKLADVVDQRVTGKLGVVGVIGQVSYTFNKSIFATMLKLSSPTPAAADAAMKIANAFEAAASASTLIVPPGSALGAPAPPTLWSVVAVSIILPPSVSIGKGLIIQMLASSPPVPDAMASQMGPALFAAFGAMQASVTGLNSLPPPAGPLPLALPAAPVL